MWSRLHDIIRAEKAPYVLTLVLGLLGWTIKHTGDRLGATPTVEYVCASQAETSLQRTSCTVTNLSQSTSRQVLHFSLKPKEGNAEVRAAGLKWHPPISPDNTPAPETAPTSAEFHVQHLPPAGSLTLWCDTTSGDAELLLAADASVKLAPSSIATFLLKYELEAFIALIVAWVVVMAAGFALYFWPL